MFRDMCKGSSVILSGALTCSVLCCSVTETVNASKTAVLSATVDVMKFAIKDVIVPLLSSVLPAFVTSMATIFATPILYFVLGYIPYYNHCVLHSKKDLGVVTSGLIWGARKFAGFLDDNASDKLISCEELAEKLVNVKNSINNIQSEFSDIQDELDDLKEKLNKVKGKDSEDGAWGRYFKYKLAVLFFSETKTSYDECEKKIGELTNLLRDKQSVFNFVEKSNVLIKDCLGKNAKIEDLKAFFKKTGTFYSKKDEDKYYLDVLAKIEKNKENIKKLVKNGGKIKKDYVNEKVMRDLSTLKDFLDILQAKEEVSKINKTVTDMDKKEEKIINGCEDFSSYTGEMKKFYLTYVQQLEKMKVVDKTKGQLSYSDEVVNEYLTSKINEIKEKQEELDSLEKQLKVWKETLNSSVEKFSSFQIDMKLEETFNKISCVTYISKNIEDEKVKSLFYEEVNTYRDDLFKKFKEKFNAWKEIIEKSKSNVTDKIKCFDRCKTLEDLEKCFEENKGSFIEQYKVPLEKMLKYMYSIRELTSSALDKDLLSELEKNSNTVLSNVTTVLDNVKMVCTFEENILSLFAIIKVKAFEEVLDGLMTKFKETCKDISFSKEILEYLLNCSENCFKDYKKILKYFSNYNDRNVLGFGVSVDELREIVYEGYDISLRKKALNELLNKKKNSLSKGLEKFVLKLLREQQKNIKQCSVIDYAEKIRGVLTLQKSLLSNRQENDAEKKFIDYEFKFITAFIEMISKKSKIDDILNYILSILRNTKKFEKPVDSKEKVSMKVFVSELSFLLHEVLADNKEKMPLEKIKDIDKNFEDLKFSQEIAGIKECKDLIKKLKSDKEKTNGKKGDNSLFANSGLGGFLKTIGLNKFMI